MLYHVRFIVTLKTKLIKAYNRLEISLSSPNFKIFIQVLKQYLVKECLNISPGSYFLCITVICYELPLYFDFSGRPYEKNTNTSCAWLIRMAVVALLL